MKARMIDYEVFVKFCRNCSNDSVKYSATEGSGEERLVTVYELYRALGATAMCAVLGYRVDGDKVIGAKKLKHACKKLLFLNKVCKEMMGKGFLLVYVDTTDLEAEKELVTDLFACLAEGGEVSET